MGAARGDARMPIRGFLTGQAFEPEVVRQMSLALETICGKFGMKLADDPATRVVALKIIELAERGVRDWPRNDSLRWPRSRARRKRAAAGHVCRLHDDPRGN